MHIVLYQFYTVFGRKKEKEMPNMSHSCLPSWSLVHAQFTTLFISINMNDHARVKRRCDRRSVKLKDFTLLVVKKRKKMSLTSPG